jgi:hypothetical protein
MKSRILVCAALALAAAHLSACEILDPTPRFYAEEYDSFGLNSGMTVNTEYGVWYSSGLEVAHGRRYYAVNPHNYVMCIIVELRGLSSTTYVSGRLDSWKQVPAGASGHYIGAVETEYELLSEYDETIRSKRLYGESCSE